MTDWTEPRRNENDHEDDCICSLSAVNSTTIDPPEMVVNRRCPVHGNAAARDPDAAYEAKRDDKERWP